MAKKLDVQEEISPNLIPMIDIMFLLLLFFMLGADMGQRELEEVRLPHAKSVKEEKESKERTGDRLTINVFHVYEKEVACPAYKRREICREEKHWRIAIKGVDYTKTEELLKRLQLEAQDYRLDPKDPKSPCERPVMVRADKQAPYGEVQKVIAQCALAKIYKIECGASRPPDERPSGEVNAKQ
ncbi:MAG TPA: hypothetical protein DCM87_02775 [Planctomycetes bacterium]|jgi:biopolymer transport protein ExbD|nr:hypothetical protein [Planctomycetota bacterium]